MLEDIIISLIISLITTTMIVIHINAIKAEPEQVLELSACWRRCLLALKLAFVLRLLLPAILMIH